MLTVPKSTARGHNVTRGADLNFCAYNSRCGRGHGFGLVAPADFTNAWTMRRHGRWVTITKAACLYHAESFARRHGVTMPADLDVGALTEGQ